jgi:hypothetical protein
MKVRTCTNSSARPGRADERASTRSHSRSSATRPRPRRICGAASSARPPGFARPLYQWTRPKPSSTPRRASRWTTTGRSRGRCGQRMPSVPLSIATRARVASLRATNADTEGDSKRRIKHSCLAALICSGRRDLSALRRGGAGGPEELRGTMRQCGGGLGLVTTVEGWLQGDPGPASQ